MLQVECGFFGNVWVNQNWMYKTGDTVGGHVHEHDHVSLLTQGSVEVRLPAHPEVAPKRFSAPTFVIIRKGLAHEIEALEDNTVWYCLHALKDIDGNVVDIYNPENDPVYPSQGIWDEKLGRWVMDHEPNSRTKESLTPITP